MCEDWLDLETKSQLERDPPEKLAPPALSGYTLVLLQRGYDRRRVDDALAAVASDASKLLEPCPLVVRTGLSYEASLEAQFELICADSVSVFLDDEVFLNATARYLIRLFDQLRKSPEFEPVSIRVDSAPIGREGDRFLKQFFGMSSLSWSSAYSETVYPIRQVASRKKARIMQHWAAKTGVVLHFEDGPAYQLSE